MLALQQIPHHRNALRFLCLQVEGASNFHLHSATAFPAFLLCLDTAATFTSPYSTLTIPPNPHITPLVTLDQ